jgi:hypothetical protein
MAETNSEKTSAFSTISAKVKEFATTITDKVKDGKFTDKLKSLAATTRDWFKSKIEWFKGLVGKQNEQQATATAPENENNTPTDDPKIQAMSVVGLDLPHPNGNEHQAIINIVQMNFMNESIAASPDGKSFDSDAVGEKVSKFMDYYGECAELDPDAADYDEKFAALGEKYGVDMAEAFDKAASEYEDYKKAYDGIKDSSGQKAYAKQHADVAYACGSLSIVEYADILKSSGKSQVGVSAETYASLGKQPEAPSAPDNTNEGSSDEKSKGDEFETYTNLNLENTDFGKDAGMSAVYMRYAMIQYAKESAKEGFVEPKAWEEKCDKFGEFINKYSALEADTKEEFDKKVEALKKEMPDQGAMMDKFNKAMDKFSEDCSSYINKHHPTGAPSSVDEQILKLYKKGEYTDKPDIDVSYALGHMDFKDYAKANGNKTLWICSNADEFNQCVTAARSAEADTAAPTASTEKTDEAEADNQ